MTPFKKPLQLLTIFLLLPLTLFSQQPLNFDFEKKSVEDNRPWGWGITTWHPSTFGTDTVQVKQGSYSLLSSCDAQAASCDKQFFNYGIEPMDFRNKAISIAGYIKAEDLDKGAHFSVQYTYLDGESEETREEEIFSEVGTGTFDWQKFSIDLRIPNRSSG